MCLVNRACRILMIVDISCWMFGRLHQPQPYRNICSAINYDLPGFLLSWVPWGMGVSFFWSDTGMAFWENLRSALELTTPSWDAPLLSHSYAPQLLALKQKSWHQAPAVHISYEAGGIWRQLVPREQNSWSALKSLKELGLQTTDSGSCWMLYEVQYWTLYPVL